MHNVQHFNRPHISVPDFPKLFTGVNKHSILEMDFSYNYFTGITLGIFSQN